MYRKQYQYANQYLIKYNNILRQMYNSMVSQNVTCSITKDFICTMIPHHLAAIQMCENLLNYTEFTPLVSIANNIIAEQTQGIENMKKPLENACDFTNENCDVCCYMDEYYKIADKMVCQMRNSPKSFNICLNFIDEMIPHHEGAIHMCENVLKYEIDPELKVIAQNIINTQSQGITEMENVRKSILSNS